VRLAYADAGGATLWDASWDASHTFTGRDGSSSVPYSWAFSPGAPECGSALTSDLAAAIADFRPDTVISPDPRETNSDHAAVAAFAMLALDETGFEGSHLTAIVHFKGFPRPTAYVPSSRLTPPAQLTGDGASWLSLPIDAVALRAKTLALARYGSQLRVADRGVYMRAFLRSNELYCLRAASVPATSATDTRPAAGAFGTIAVTPPPVIVPARPNPVRVLSLRMVRGPQRVWFGLVSAGSSDEATYTLALRLPGEPGAPRRLDIRVHEGRPTALGVDRTSIVTTDLTTVRDGGTVWVSLPASIFTGGKWALASCGSSLPGYGPSHTPWVDVRP
jgi:LmbE family N-acetylglucosaminyl deacetylase